MEKIKLSEYPKHKKNPFHSSTIESLKVRKFPIHPQGPVLNVSTGEIVKGDVYLNKRFAYADTAPATKVYKAAAEILAQLSGPSIKMFFFILAVTSSGNDKVYISPKSALRFTGYSSTKDIYKGIAELIRYEIIARSDETLMYYINPNVLFCGNKSELLSE
jgi:hypothetical protein